MRMKCLVVAVIMALLAWTGAAMATPLILDDYLAQTQAQNGNESLSDDDSGTVPPVSAYSETLAEDAEGIAESLNTNSLYVSAFTQYNGDRGSSAYGSMAAWKDQITISADLPQLHIYFKYNLYVKVDDTGSGSTIAGHAEASLHPMLIDFTPGSYGFVVWDLPDSLTLDNSSGTEIINTASDTIDEIINLTPGHQYAINFYPFEVKAWAYDGQEAWAYGEITGIDLQLVPLPSSLLLASTGLLGLLAWRRKRKF